MSDRQEKNTGSKGTADQEVFVGNSDGGPAFDGNVVNVKTLELFNGEVDQEMGKIVDTVEDRIQNAILTAIDKVYPLKIELAIG